MTCFACLMSMTPILLSNHKITQQIKNLSRNKLCIKLAVLTTIKAFSNLLLISFNFFSRSAWLFNQRIRLIIPLNSILVKKKPVSFQAFWSLLKRASFYGFCGFCLKLTFSVLPSLKMLATRFWKLIFARRLKKYKTCQFKKNCGLCSKLVRF